MRETITSLMEVFHVKDITTDVMKDAIYDWEDLYYGADVEGEDDNQRLAYTIVRKLTKNIFAEYTAEGKSDFEKAVLEALGRARKKAMQQALIGGEILLKPLFFKDRLDFAVMPRSSLVIAGRNEKNEIIDLCSEERCEEDENYFTLCERRKVVDGRLSIETKLFKSDNPNSYGRETSLSTLSRYRDVDPQINIPVDSVGLIPLTCPIENCVDGTDDAVAVYAAAAKLIHKINLNEAQINGEFERGESRILVSNDYLTGTKGSRKLTDNIFVGLDDDPENVGIQIFAPAFREQSYLNRKREYLRNIESVIGLKRGLLSEVESEDKTATEVTSSAGDYNTTVIDFQEAWETTVRKAMDITAQLYQAYRMGDTTHSEETTVIGWGNGVLYDENKTWADMLTLVQMGLLKPEIAVAWYFDKDIKDPKVLEEVRNKYMPQMQQLLEGE